MKKYSLIFVLFLCGIFYMAHGYEVTEVKNGGVISGRVCYSGKEAHDSLVKVGTHSEYCGEQVELGRLRVGTDSGVQWATVMITWIEKGKCFDSIHIPLVHNIDCRFEPRVSLIQSHTPIKIMNGDKIPHRAHFALIKDSGQTKDLMSIAVPWAEMNLGVSRMLGHTGLVGIYGIVHPFERGWIWMMAHPYGEVTDKNGKFSMKDVPPGIYKLRVWHEYLGEQTVTVIVRAGDVSDVTVIY
ncbi:MAG: carboxypeptidase regulatory-like domain-containing protein [Fibrobacteria bacterium]|nr:carboxypeptidase regulatory-like domain-containing protein [Fibrobacteria bacterium]